MISKSGGSNPPISIEETSSYIGDNEMNSSSSSPYPSILINNLYASTVCLSEIIKINMKLLNGFKARTHF